MATEKFKFEAEIKGIYEALGRDEQLKGIYKCRLSSSVLGLYYNYN